VRFSPGWRRRRRSRRRHARLCARASRRDRALRPLPAPKRASSAANRRPRRLAHIATPGHGFLNRARRGAISTMRIVRTAVAVLRTPSLSAIAVVAVGDAVVIAIAPGGVAIRSPRSQLPGSGPSGRRAEPRSGCCSSSPAAQPPSCPPPSSSGGGGSPSSPEPRRSPGAAQE
jgi:hypothetical protein